MPIWMESVRISSEKVLAFKEIWDNYSTGDIVPLRNAFNPAQFPRLMPHIVISEIQPDPFQVTYRLVGTLVSEISRFDFTGTTLNDLDFAAADDNIWMACHKIIYESRKPVYGRMNIPHEQESLHAIPEEFGIFPVSHDGKNVHQTIAIEDYLPPDKTDLTQGKPMHPRS